MFDNIGMALSLQEQIGQFGKIRSMMRGLLPKGPKRIIGVIECSECGSRSTLRKVGEDYCCAECYRKGQYLGRAEE